MIVTSDHTSSWYGIELASKVNMEGRREKGEKKKRIEK
jgi:hypothetical protein